MVEFIQICTNIVLAGAAFLQVVLLYCGFKVAETELARHRRKIKVENQEKYAFKINELLVEMEDLFRKILDDEPQNVKEESDFRNNNRNIPSDFLIKHFKPFWVEERSKNFMPELYKIRSKISTYSNFLDDKKIITLYQKILMQRLFIISNFKQANKKQMKILKESSFNPSIGNWANFPKEKLDEIYRPLPKSIFDRRNKMIIHYNSAFKDLIDYLKKYIN